MKKLETMTAEQLQSAPYAPVPFLVDELLPEGLHILAGAPKIGKSWLALWLCLCVSQGQPLWNFDVMQGEVLYLSLEDSYTSIFRVHQNGVYTTYVGNPFNDLLVNIEDEQDIRSWTTESMHTLEGGKEAFYERKSIYESKSN